MFEILDRRTSLTGNQIKILAAAIIGVLKLAVIFIILFVVIKWQLVHIIGLVGGLSLCFLAILWEGAAMMKQLLRNGGQ